MLFHSGESLDYFFFKDHDKTVTATEERYVEAFKLSREELVSLSSFLRGNLWFQRNRANAHTLHMSSG